MDSDHLPGIQKQELQYHTFVFIRQGEGLSKLWILERLMKRRRTKRLQWLTLGQWQENHSPSHVWYTLLPLQSSLWNTRVCADQCYFVLHTVPIYFCGWARLSDYLSVLHIIEYDDVIVAIVSVKKRRKKQMGRKKTTRKEKIKEKREKRIKAKRKEKSEWKQKEKRKGMGTYLRIGEVKWV